MHPVGWLSEIFAVTSERYRIVFWLARFKAAERGSRFIEVADLLAALVLEDQGWLPESWRKAGSRPCTSQGAVGRGVTRFFSAAEAEEVLAKVAAFRPQEPGPPPGGDALPSEAVKRSFGAAARLRDALGAPRVEPLHLLAAVLAEQGQEPAVQAVAQAGITEKRVVKAARGAKRRRLRLF